MSTKSNNILEEEKLPNEKDSPEENLLIRFPAEVDFCREPIAKEIGGFKGQEPTKYGDWQHRGRVTDF